MARKQSRRAGRHRRLRGLRGLRRALWLVLGGAAISAGVWTSPATAADDTSPPSTPTNAYWTDSTGLLIDRTSGGDERVRASWSRSTDAGGGVADYRIQVSEAPDFAEVLVDRLAGSTSTYHYVDATDGITSGGSYYFRVSAVDAAGNESDFSSPSNRVDVRENPDGPALVHAPVVTAPYGRPIPIEVVSTCGSQSSCEAVLSYRTTPVSSALVDTTTLSGGFERVALERAGTTTVNGREAVRWTGEIPGDVVTTEGVDYSIEVTDTFAVGRFPGTTYAGTPHTVGIQGTGTHHHVHVVTPPLLSHTPPAFGRSDEALPLELVAVCGGTCEATVYFRTTDGDVLGSEGEIVAENGELIATPGWPSAEMTATGTEVRLDGAGTATVFSAEIPVEYVDTRGVDYFFHVTDGHTQAWAPGTTYEGYYAPLDGMRTGYYHARVTETPHIVHAPVAASPYRESIPVEAYANCPSTRMCEATLSYRTTDRTALAGTDGFAEAPMSVEVVERLDGTDLVRLTGTIPAEVADTRGVDYFFRITDGATTSWWPGVSPNDGYAFTDGVRVGYHHVRVLEPPHFLHVPLPAAGALEDLEISTDLVCATEACAVELSYASGAPAATWVTVPMERIGVRTTTHAGRVETWSATIPGSDVTTHGLSYYMTATDGYTNTAAPGTSYHGAYVPIDGGTLSLTGTPVAFPVRVLEPPHPVHAPVLVSDLGEPIAIDATSNCATDACVATLHWRIPGGEWQETTMAATPGDLFGDVWSFSAVIPAEAVTPAGVDYRVEVHDGYAAGSTPTWPVLVVDPGMAPTVDPTPLGPVSGSVTVVASGPADAVSVELWVDDVLVARRDGSTLSVAWDTSTVTDGTHTLWVRAEGASGASFGAGTTVSVQNLL